MGTRSLTIVNRSKDLKRSSEICVIYRHYDGYPKGHGQDLLDFLSNCIITNGIPASNNEGEKHFSNGFDDLAAQLVCYLKEDYRSEGGIYLNRPGSIGFGENYIYTIYPNKDNNRINLKIKELYEGKTLYNGPVDELDISAL